jgi:hypothetical protein
MGGDSKKTHIIMNEKLQGAGAQVVSALREFPCSAVVLPER